MTCKLHSVKNVHINFSANSLKMIMTLKNVLNSCGNVNSSILTAHVEKITESYTG